ncbi:MAG: alkaline phosphatase family protein [Anaerolineales bacterium]|nr:alkaline phosphatase family protein [Anaerolineales bacterium]
MCVRRSDRVQHMFFKGREDVIESWYIRLDQLAGRIIEKASHKKKTRVLVISDHGFRAIRLQGPFE